ncbi:MAG: HlyD family secretion protein [Bacteroidales bacterium]|jgi:hypothetical protein|nr:HlyD family secretion protein [Bacteroidales bacterium]
MDNNVPFDIEIRSKKVRNIIGQVPPYLIRVGFTIMFVFFAILIAALYFFEYDYVINASASITPKSDSTVLIKINIPVNQIERIKAGQIIIISFDNIDNMSGQSIQLNIEEYISPIVDMISSGGFYTMDFTEKNPILSENLSFHIRETLILNAEIHMGKERLFHKILNL